MTDQGPEHPEHHEELPPPPLDPTPVPAPGATSAVGAPADLGTRLLARIIDAVIIWVASFVILIPLVVGAVFATATTGVNPFGAGFNLAGFVGGILAAAVWVGYFAFMESRNGQTLGKMALGLKTVGPEGGNPTMEQALKRNAWLALSIIPVVGGLAQLAAAIYIAVTINSSPTNTGWHDEFAGGTSVIRTK